MLATFQPISSCSTYLRSDKNYKLSCDLRLRRRHINFFNSLKTVQSSILHRIGSNLGELRAFYRLLSNECLDMSDMINNHCQISPELLSGRHVLALGDGVSINLTSAYGRMNSTEQGKVGVLENNQTRGLMSQVILSIDAATSEVLGLSDIVLYNRAKREGKVEKHQARQLIYDQKESSKWSLSAQNAKVHLQGCQKLTYIFDRDSDRFETLQALARIPDTDFIIRTRENRMVIYQGEHLRVNQILEQLPIMGSYELDIKKLNHPIREGRARKQRKARKSTMEVRWFAIDQINAPSGISKKEKIVGPFYYLQVKERLEDVPQGEDPIEWTILTTHFIDSLKESQLIVHYYQQRWHIEQLFRVCKTQGFELESTQLESINAIMRLTIMTMAAACQIMQLNLAREHTTHKIDFVFDQQEQQVLSKLNEELEGRTKKSKNPNVNNQLSWARWVIARLGGWKGYQSQGPPGPITISRGFKEFQTYKKAWLLFASQ